MLQLINDTIEQVVAAYSRYTGIGSYMILFFAALLYIYITERRKDNRDLLFYYPLLALAVIFNPLIASRIIAVIDKEVYWRIFWILPITIVIACAATSIAIHTPEKFKKAVVVFFLTAILILGGKFIFSADNFSTPPNWYKLPDQSIEVCKIMEADCNGVIRVVVPAELETTIRQYDAGIQMVYGRGGNLLYAGDSEDARLYRYWLRKYMNQDVLDIMAICDSMRYFDCNYIVLNRKATLSGNMGDFGYHCIASTDSYNIYRIDYEEITTTE